MKLEDHKRLLVWYGCLNNSFQFFWKFVWVKKCVEIHVILFKNWKHAFKHKYQTGLQRDSTAWNELTSKQSLVSRIGFKSPNSSTSQRKRVAVSGSGHYCLSVLRGLATQHWNLLGLLQYYCLPSDVATLPKPDSALWGVRRPLSRSALASLEQSAAVGLPKRCWWLPLIEWVPCNSFVEGALAVAYDTTRIIPTNGANWWC